MNIVIRILIALLIVASAATAGLAETRYVSDVLVVTVRSAKGDNYQVIETLRSATPFEVLDEDRTYVRVRTPDGNEGYILKQYTTTELPKAIQVERLTRQVETLKNQLEQQQQDNEAKLASASESISQAADLSAQLQETREKLETVQSEYESLLQDSQNVLALSTENEDLIEKNKQLNNELVVLREENRNFHRTNMIQWFLAGGGVFFGGWVIGKLSRKKQRGFSRL